MECNRRKIQFKLGNIDPCFSCQDRTCKNPSYAKDKEIKCYDKKMSIQ